jgi:Nucleotide-sugar transporter
VHAVAHALLLYWILSKMPSPVRGGSILPSSSKDTAMSNLKSVVLVTLVIQNSSLALFMKYSRSHTGKAPMYAATTAVVCAELVKVVVSLVLQAKVRSCTLCTQICMVADACCIVCTHCCRRMEA